MTWVDTSKLKRTIMRYNDEVYISRSIALVRRAHTLLSSTTSTCCDTIASDDRQLLQTGPSDYSPLGRPRRPGYHASCYGKVFRRWLPIDQRPITPSPAQRAYGPHAELGRLESIRSLPTPGILILWGTRLWYATTRDISSRSMRSRPMYILCGMCIDGQRVYATRNRANARNMKKEGCTVSRTQRPRCDKCSHEAQRRDKKRQGGR